MCVDGRFSKIQSHIGLYKATDFCRFTYVKSILSAKELGVTQYKELVADRITNSKVYPSQIRMLTWNNLLLFPNKNNPKSHFKVTSLKKTIHQLLTICCLLWSVKIAYIFRTILCTQKSASTTITLDLLFRENSNRHKI